jgi:hypothetical protein
MTILKLPHQAKASAYLYDLLKRKDVMTLVLRYNTMVAPCRMWTSDVQFQILHRFTSLPNGIIVAMNGMFEGFPECTAYVKESMLEKYRGPSEKYVSQRQFVSIKTATTAQFLSVCDRRYR